LRKVDDYVKPSCNVNPKLARQAGCAGVIIQIYEIQQPNDVEWLVAAGVDHIGSVLLSEADWKVAAIRETVAAVQSAGAKSAVIPLFHTVDRVMRVLDYYRPDIIHFCETLENPSKIGRLIDLQRAVRSRFPQVRIMRSIPVPGAGARGAHDALAAARQFESVSDMFLTDTLLPGAPAADQPVSGFVGITGTVCDWGVAALLVKQSRIPVILAGGISPYNVADGIRCVKPAGVDSCTQTNAQDDRGRPIRFKKDPERVARLVAAVRRAEAGNTADP
jgi:phosphoribosylanthranilate isomerase